MWRLIYSIPIWALMFVIGIPLYILGWVFVPIAAFAKEYSPGKSFRDGREIQLFNWPWMLPFLNLEDGILEGRQYKNFKSDALQIIYWSCVRNPVHGINFVPLLSVIPDPKRVRFIGSFGDCAGPLVTLPEELINMYDTKIPQWFFAWQGLYSNWYWQFKIGDGLWRVWFGFKLYPTDRLGVSPTSYRQKGAGCAFQVKRVL